MVRRSNAARKKGIREPLTPAANEPTKPIQALVVILYSRVPLPDEHGRPKVYLRRQLVDYAVWLLHVRDGLCWHQIAYRFFPKATEEDIAI